MKKHIFFRKGFTLIELLLYISISSIILLGIVSFLFMLLSARVKNQTVAEVEQQGTRIMQMFAQAIRNADTVNSPALGSNASSLSINTIVNGNNPTVFDLSDGVLRIKEGNTETVLLSNVRVIISELSFLNVSRENTPGVIRVQFRVTHENPENKNEYAFNKIFFGSAALRQ